MVTVATLSLLLEPPYFRSIIVSCCLIHRPCIIRYVYDLAQEYLTRVEINGGVVEYTYTEDGALSTVQHDDGSRDLYHWQHTGIVVYACSIYKFTP